ncbi:GxxExxY protein [soil metagenome]
MEEQDESSGHGKFDGKEDGTAAVIGAAIEVHRTLGPGLLESIYQKAMQYELNLRKIPFEYQNSVPVIYKGFNIGEDLKLDLIVDGRIVVEIKSVEKLIPIHEAQLITYLKLMNAPIGLLMNFNSKVLKDQLRRFRH